MDLDFSEENFQVSNFENISQNQDYDSQPFFIDNEQIVYARTYDVQTDIVKYHLKEKSLINLSETTIGGEYSPQLIPNTTNYSAVRLDTTGLQRIYKYNTFTKTNILLIEGLLPKNFTDLLIILLLVFLSILNNSWIKSIPVEKIKFLCLKLFSNS